MRRCIRRVLIAGLFGGGAAAGWKVWSSRRVDPASATEPSWPPMAPGSAAVPPATASLTVVRSDDAEPASRPSAETGTPAVPHTLRAVSPLSTWVEPSDGTCPASHPVKANDDSGIFHVPGGRFYDRTRAERCYTTAEAAEADGYRRSKI